MIADMAINERDHVLLLSFTDAERCRAAFEEAKNLPGLRQSAILARTSDEDLRVLDGYVRRAGIPTLGSSVVGMLIGLIGGPVGGFLGLSAGALLGNAAEAKNLTDGGAALITLSTRVEANSSLLILDARESSAEPADALAQAYGVRLERLPAAEFAEQVREVERAADQVDAEETADSGGEKG